MKRLTIVFIALLFVTACEQRHANPPNPFWDISKDANLFYKLSIVSFGAISPTHTEQEIVLNDDKTMGTHIWLYEDFTTLKNNCEGSADLTDKDYGEIMQLITTANLFEYVPPQPSDADCKLLVGGSGYLITYMRTDKSYNEIHTACEMNQKIYDLIDAVSKITLNDIPSCTEEALFSGSPPPQEGEQFCGSSTLASCGADSDCMASGCMGEMCHGKDELITDICVTRACADPKQYNLTCHCHENQCQWL